MPDPIDPQLDEDTGPMNDAGESPDSVVDNTSSTQAPTDTTQPQTAPTATILPPPHWKDIASLPDFQKLDKGTQGEAFTKWVKDSDDYLASANVPRQALNTFSSYVEQTGPKYGLGFIFNENGRPLTIGQQAETTGVRPAGVPNDTNSLQWQYEKDLPATQQIQAPDNSIVSTVDRGLAGMGRGLTDLFTKPIAEGVDAAGHGVAKVWNYVTGTEPSTGLLDNLDKGIAVLNLNEKMHAASEGGLNAEERIGETAGNLVTSTLGGASLWRMGAIASTQAADDTYHNALDQGATEGQAVASAGVAATVSGATFAVLGGANNALISKVLGSKSAAFLAGAYRPTVSEATALMAGDATALAATGGAGQILQNKADQALYDPNRPTMSGVASAAGGAALFAVIHAPTMVKALFDNRSEIQSAKTDVLNAQSQVDLLTKKGESSIPVEGQATTSLQDAQKQLDDAKAKLNSIVNKTVQNAPPPTAEDVQEAKGVVNPTPEATLADPLDQIIQQNQQQAASPTELPTVGETTSPPIDEVTKPVSQPEVTPQEPIVPEATSQGIGPMTDQAVKQPTEIIPNAESSKEEAATKPPDNGQAEPTSQEAKPAEPGSNETPESAPVVAEQPKDDLATLDRPTLEKVAADEAHSPEAIAIAKSDSDLRDLIEGHRAGLEVSPEQSLVPDKKALIDPKIATLPDILKSHVLSFIKGAQKFGLRGVKNFVIDTRAGSGNGDAAVFARPRDGKFNTVYINPVTLSRENALLKSSGYSDAEISHLRQVQFSEEFEHNIGGKAIESEWKRNGSHGNFSDYYDKKFASVYDKMSIKDRKRLIERYGSHGLGEVDITKPSTEIGQEMASRIGEEHFREVLQRKGGKGVTEDAITAVRSGKRILDEEAIAAIKRNKPLRSIIKAIADKFKSVTDKAREALNPDTVIEERYAELQKLLGEDKVESKPIVKSKSPKKVSASASLGDDTDYLSENTPSKPKPQEVAQQEQTRYEKAQDKWNQRLQAVKDVPLSNESQNKLHAMAQKMARYQFGADNANRDIAEGNAFFKVMVQAREWAKENGSLDAPNSEGKKFAASTIIRNTLLDEGRYAARRSGIASDEPIEAPEPAQEGEEAADDQSVPTKGIDTSETDHEANQQAFEPTGQEPNEGITTETPRAKANNAAVDANIKKIFGDVTPYERRLLELSNDDPEGWAKDAADEFDLSEPQVTKDMADLRSRVEANLSHSGLGRSDFQRMSSSASIEAPKLTEADKPPILSPAASLKWNQTKTILDKIKTGIHEATSLSNYGDWEKFTGQYGRIIAQGVQNSNAVVRRFKELLPDKVKSGAVIRYIEAGGDRSTLEAWLKKTKSNPDTAHLAPYYEAALKLTPEEVKAGSKASQLLETTRQLAKTWGIDINKRDNYFPHNVEKDASDNYLTGSGDNLNVSFKYGKQRTHTTMFDGEQSGIKYKSNDVGEGTGAYLNDLYRAVNARKFVASLAKGIEDDGRPMVAPSRSSWLEISNPSKGQVHLVFDKGPREDLEDYVKLDIPALKNWAYAGNVDGVNVLHQTDLLIHPRTAAKIENVFGKSNRLKSWWESPSLSGTEAISKRVTKLLFNDINSIAKSNLFALSPIFHPIQIGMESLGHMKNPMGVKALTDAAKFIPSETIRAMDGIKPPDFNDPATARAVDHGLELHPEESDLLAEGGSNIDHTFLRGLEILGQKLGKKPGELLTKFKQANQDAQNWIFQKYIPAIKLQNYNSALSANKNRFASELASGKYSIDDVEFQTAKTINYAYGHLNYRQMARNPNIQTALRTLLLAPDFFEARAKHLGQALQGAAGLKSGRENFQAMARLTVGLAVAAQTANYFLNGETDLSHPFEVRIGNRYYGLRSAPGDALNLFKDSYAVATKNDKGLAYLNNRLSPLARFLGEAQSGRNWRGEQVGSLSAITDLIAGATPMIAQGYLGQVPGLDKVFGTQRNNTVSPFETALGALGVKVSRYSPIQEMKAQGHEFVKNNPDKFGIKPSAAYPPSPYRPLEFALEDANSDAAYTEYQKLISQPKSSPGSVLKGLQISVKRPFTGSTGADIAFRASLDAHDKALFDAAKQRQAVLIQRYFEMLRDKQK